MGASVRRLAVLLACLFAQAHAADSRARRPAPREPRRLLRVADGQNRFGFIDATGKLVIGFDRLPSTTVRVGDFSEGLAAIFLRLSNPYRAHVGYIDEAGRMVIPAKFYFGHSFVGGRASVELTEGGWRAINRRGEFVPAEWPKPPAERLGDPARAVAYRVTGEAGRVIEGRAYAEQFVEGLAAVLDNGGRTARYGFINPKGELVIPFRFEPLREHHGFIRGLGHFSEGLASVKLDGRFGYVDKRGRFVVPPQFIAAGDFSEGLALVSTEDESGYIDKRGRWVVRVRDPRQARGRFRDGLAPVSFATPAGEKFGYIDRRGRVRIAPRFDHAQEFDRSVARVYEVRDPAAPFESRFGYIDRAGRYIWEPRSGPKARAGIRAQARRVRP